MTLSSEILRDAEIIYNFHASFSSPPGRADFLLLAGSHDLRVPLYAAKLYHLGCAPLLLCSGGYGKITVGLFHDPEAVVFSRVCTENGVPDSCILLEQKSTNTGENFSLSRNLLRELKIFPKTGIIVCKPYMSARTWATASMQWPEVTWSVNAPPIPFAEYPTADAPIEQEIHLMVGDLQRLSVYAEKGYQVPVSVPDAVLAAYNRLVAAGFDSQVIR